MDDLVLAVTASGELVIFTEVDSGLLRRVAEALLRKADRAKIAPTVAMQLPPEKQDDQT